MIETPRSNAYLLYIVWVLLRQRVESDLPLRRSPETRIGLSVATALSMRVDQLLRVLSTAGVHASRKELISGALLELPEDPQELRRVVERFRTETVSDALVPRPSSRSVTLVRHGPGPRPRE